MTVPVAGRGPEPERPVHVHPGVCRAGKGTRGLEGIEGPGVEVTGLKAHHRGRARGSAERRGERVQLHAAPLVDGKALDRIRADPEQPHRAQDRLVPALAHEDSHGGRPAQPLGLDVPPAVLEEPVPRRGEGGGVGHLTPGHEGEGDRGGQTEEILQPATTDLLDDGGGGARRGRRRILIPGGGEPVGGEGHRQHPADDPAEEPPPGRIHEGAVQIRDQLVQDLDRIRWMLGHRLHEPLAECGRGHRRTDRSMWQSIQVGQGVGACPMEELALGHGVGRSPGHGGPPHRFAGSSGQTVTATKI